MIEANTAEVAARFREFLAKVQQGESVRIREEGRAIARIVPDAIFMPGIEAAKLFESSSPDPETADAVAAEIVKLRAEADDALANRY